MPINDIHEDLSSVQVEEVMSNMDNPLRHNVGGSMNRPTRNDDPLASRNIPVPPEPVRERPFDEKVADILTELHNMLMAKNKKYGNSALEPVRIFSKADAKEQIKVRIDDKLSRIYTASELEDEDVIDDLLGYLILLKIADGK